MVKKPETVNLNLGSPDRFGYSWDRYNDIKSEHEEQFRRWTTPLGPADWVGARFIDGGCGIGRNSFWPLKYGALGGVGVDVDGRTLSRARENLRKFPDFEVRHQSIYDIAERDTFDIAFSIGVVHHLEYPERAVKSLARATRPGGRVLIWIYGRENNDWIVKFADPLRKLLFSRLPLRVVHWLSWPATILLWAMLRLGLKRIEYFRLIRRFSFEHLRAIVFDHMIPRIAIYYRKDQAIELLRSAGLENVEAYWVNEMSWAVSGCKPFQDAGDAVHRAAKDA
jgi:SAM-dependent methyltransferase